MLATLFLKRKSQHVGHEWVICGSHLDCSVVQWVKWVIRCDPLSTLVEILKDSKASVYQLYFVQQWGIRICLLCLGFAWGCVRTYPGSWEGATTSCWIVLLDYGKQSSVTRKLTLLAGQHCNIVVLHPDWSNHPWNCSIDHLILFLSTQYPARQHHSKHTVIYSRNSTTAYQKSH